MNGLKRLNIYSDCHKTSPGQHEWKGEFKFGEDVIHCGDNFEFKNIPYKKVNQYKEEFKKFLNMCKITNTVYVASNHGVRVERDYVGVYEIVKTFNYTRILIVHGHRLYWSGKKCREWENKRPGKGWWKLQSIAFKNGKFKESKEKRPPQRVIDECVRLCKLNNCTTIIFGHTHRTADFMEKGIRIVNVGRGETSLWI